MLVGIPETNKQRCAVDVLQAFLWFECLHSFNLKFTVRTGGGGREEKGERRGSCDKMLQTELTSEMLQTDTTAFFIFIYLF